MLLYGNMMMMTQNCFMSVVSSKCVWGSSRFLGGMCVSKSSMHRAVRVCRVLYRFVWRCVCGVCCCRLFLFSFHYCQSHSSISPSSAATCADPHAINASVRCCNSVARASKSIAKDCRRSNVSVKSSVVVVVDVAFV